MCDDILVCKMLKLKRIVINNIDKVIIPNLIQSTKYLKNLGLIYLISSCLRRSRAVEWSNFNVTNN